MEENNMIDFASLLDPDISILAEQSLPDLILAVFGLIGCAAALGTFLFFTGWSVYQIVKFIRSLIKA